MAQRDSGYERQEDELYETPVWVTQVIADWLRQVGVRSVWEPAAGPGKLASALRDAGMEVVATTSDFFLEEKIPKVDAIVTNPPYGPTRRGDMATQFARTARGTEIPIVAMLLPVDFDSAKGRRNLFGDCPTFAGKIVLLDRIVWFERPGAAPSSNHAWFVWAKAHTGLPWILYRGKNGVSDAIEARLKQISDIPKYLGDGEGRPPATPSRRRGAIERSSV
jgi:hypothetical protein